MASYLNFDNRCNLKTQIDERAKDLFQSIPGKPQLQVNIYSKGEKDTGVASIVRHQDVNNVLKINALKRV